MPKKRFQFRWQILWGFAIAMIVVEAGRVFMRDPVPDIEHGIRNQHSTPQDTDAEKIVAEFLVPAGPVSVILVLGNLGPSFDGEVDVTISAQPESAEPEKSHRPNSSVAAREKSGPVLPRQMASAFQADQRSGDPFAPRFDSNSRSEPHCGESRFPACEASRDYRTYFLPTARGPSGLDSSQTPIQCSLAHENQHARIYVDVKALPGDALTHLIQAVDQASDSEIAMVIDDLVGVVDDVDGDGRLAIVLTPDVERLGTANNPVKGLTRSSDFVRGLDRPGSNQSDVIFLSSNLSPGDDLKAVLAHEWCHAAVFSRRMIGTRVYRQRPSEDDWLNEAIAHVVEVRASGSWTNLSHRIHSFLSRPESSPLIVRDYYHSDFWRHDGCRGAAFLFLQWCVDQAGDSLFDALLDSPGCMLESLEQAMGRSFSDLFLDWSRSLGWAVADQIRSSEGESKLNPTMTAHPQRWRLTDGAERSRTVRVCGVSVAFVQIDCDPPATAWRFSVSTSRPAQLQASLIPIAGSKP